MSLQTFNNIVELSPLTRLLTDYANQEHNIDAVGADIKAFHIFEEGSYNLQEPHYWVRYVVVDQEQEKYVGYLCCTFNIINNEVLCFVPLAGSLNKVQVNHMLTKAIVNNRVQAVNRSKIYDIRLHQWQIEVIKLALETFNDPAKDGCLPPLPPDNPNIDDSPMHGFKALKELFNSDIQESPCINAFVL